MRIWARLLITAIALITITACGAAGRSGSEGTAGTPESISCGLPGMSRDAFMSEFERSLAADGGDSSPFTFLILTEDWKEAEPSDKVSSVNMTLGSGEAASLSREDIRLCVRSMIAAAFSGDDSWTDDTADFMMGSYDSGQAVSIDEIDGYRLYSSFTPEGGCMLIEPYCEQCIYDLQR